ncbi:apoptotic protease-activating factor 1 isoform X2 [Halyomorpha halys]|nr:apoptotic protease-activating factor 1 [Halyomorpha halys]XP_014282025.1 apoptotic protease-activating factor 1 [Halyomorpha halys]
MSSISRQVISDNWKSLIDDLQEDVILGSKSILTEDEFETINNLGNDQQMIEHFLNTMIKKSKKELDVFIESLRIYYPWLYKNLIKTIDKYNRTAPLCKVKMLGGIPNLPQRIIERTNLLSKLKSSLKKLKKGEYIVLHGMLGSGKTTLAATALNDYELIKTCFKGSVYWLTVGKVGKEDLGFLQQQLNERFPDPVQLSPSSHLATIQLTKMLIEKGLCDNLIVLDDVKDQMVLDCFAIGAKFLVITEDKGVIGNQNESSAHCIKVDEGFSLHETLELFSKSLNVKDIALPSQASDIHQYTKGHPLTISLIAGQLENYKDSVMKDYSRWDHYVKMLSNKNRRRSFNDLESFYSAMKESIESLGENKIFFQQLAVFVKDVNIKPEVLGILWKMDKYDAEAMMFDFVRKSLAVMKWNELQDSYVYGVHDLVSDFLKNHLKSEEQELHKNFILNYKAECKEIWSNLPKNDNYIFYYIGYHLRKAGGAFHDLFKSLYFDLPFLEAKLRVCGPADLIQDYKTYKGLITSQNEELKKKAEEFSTFIEYHGVSIANGIAIIQAALQEPTTSSVHVAAVHLAKSKKCKELYLHSSPLSPVDRVILPDTLEIDEEIKIVCFGRTTNEVIVAVGHNGKSLKLYNIRAKGVLKEYIGHTNKITSLDVSSCKTLLLSSSMDNTIRVWSLENGESSQGDRSPSPTERQLYFMNLFNNTLTNEVGKSNALYVLKPPYPVLWSVFSKKDSSIIASLGPTNISVWISGKQKWEIKCSPSAQFRCLDFLDEQFVAAGGSDQIVLYLSETGAQYQQINYNDFISLRSLPVTLGGGLVILTKDRLTLYSQKANNDYPCAPVPSVSFKQLHSVGTHIATTTESGELYVFHFFTGSVVYYVPHMSGQLNSVCVNDKAILLGYSNGYLYLNPLDGLPSPLTSIKWKLGNEPILIKMDHSKENIEVVMGKEKKIIGERRTEIKLADISMDGKIIILAYEGGRIAYKELEEEHGQTIITENAVPIRLYLLEDATEKFVIAFYESKEALLWKVSEKKLVKLNDKRSIGCSSASYLKLGNYPCLITTAPMTIWNLFGEPIECKLSGIHQSVNSYCVRPDLKTFVYAAADKTWLVDSLYSETNLNIKSGKLLAFSPSGKTLAALCQQGILTIFDCLKKRLGFVTEIPDNSTCLAVSDSGCVCIGGSNHLSIFTKEGLSSKIVLNTRSVVAKPNGEDKFAVADSSGVVYIVYLDVINGEEEILVNGLNINN